MFPVMKPNNQSPFTNFRQGSTRERERESDGVRGSWDIRGGKKETREEELEINPKNRLVLTWKLPSPSH